MNIREVFEIYDLISIGMKDLPIRYKLSNLRKAHFNKINYSKSLIKVAFDTRRIDQEVAFNPRRNLQNYQRSQKFISDVMGKKLRNIAKLRSVLGALELQYGREPEWQESNARVLLSSVDKGLRHLQKDGDYSDSQPAMGSLDYIEELLHVRYRLAADNLISLGEQNLRNVILSKDENLVNKNLNKEIEDSFNPITKQDVATKSYDTLVDKLFGDVRASAERPDIERTVTITIRDKFGSSNDE